MPTKRKRIGRKVAARITPEAIEAWRAGDVWGLHRALALRPWQDSPLAMVERSASPSKWALEVMALREQLEALNDHAD